MSDLRLDFDLLSRTARDHEQLRDDVRSVEHARQAAPLERGALGKILPAEEIYAEFDEATSATQENLVDLLESLDGMAERLLLCRDLNYGEEPPQVPGLTR